MDVDEDSASVKQGAFIRWFNWLAIFCLLMTTAFPVTANNDKVLVIGDDSRSYVSSFLGVLKNTLEKSGISVEVIAPDALNTKIAAANGYLCIVTVGNDSARVAAEQPITLPVLHALVTAELANEIYPHSTNSPKSVRTFLLVEQPVYRLLLLANRAMPERKRIGVLYGPASIRSQSEVERQASRTGVVLVEREADNDAQLTEVLTYFSANADLLITLPDPVIVNQGSIKTLMLGAYHGNLPLLGYSLAMVKAGSLMAIHSTPEQFGLQSGELIRGRFWNDESLSDTQLYPRYFHVSVNYQVARALDIDLPSENELERRIKKVEQGR